MAGKQCLHCWRSETRGQPVQMRGHDGLHGLFGNKLLAPAAAEGYHLRKTAHVAHMSCLIRCLLEESSEKNDMIEGPVSWVGVESESVVGDDDAIEGKPVGLGHGPVHG